MSQLKKELYRLCELYVADSIKAIKQKIADAQESANDDTKSSAGDKYETGREMMQQEIDLNKTRLSEAQKQQESLVRIDPSVIMQKIQTGSLVYTTGINYYIAIPTGKLTVNGVVYVAVSPVAPVVQLLSGKAAGDTFTINGVVNTIEKVE